MEITQVIEEKNDILRAKLEGMDPHQSLESRNDLRFNYDTKLNGREIQGSISELLVGLNGKF